ncbi:MAG: hypothetical protein Q8N03_03355 [Ignavibacteria bacterium]|nr:hypothetical protein [Ignavibacteria bacterium]
MKKTQIKADKYKHNLGIDEPDENYLVVDERQIYLSLLFAASKFSSE